MLSEKRYQQTLSFIHQTATTSNHAFEEVKPKQKDRDFTALMFLMRAGRLGHTRLELATKMRIAEKSICSVVRKLIHTGQAVENGDTRLSPSGHPSKIVRLPQYADHQAV